MSGAAKAAGAVTAAPPASLAGLGRVELAGKLGELAVPTHALRMRTAQLWHWIYHRGATEFSQMTTIGKEMRSALGGAFSLARPRIVSEHVSSDGTRKWL